MNAQYKMLLEQMQRHLDALDANAEILDSKIQTGLSVTSLLLGIVGAIQLQGNGALAVAAVLIAAALYVAMFYVSIRALFPRRFKYPVKPEWDVLMVYAAMEEDASAEQLLSDYLECFKWNAGIIAQKARAAKWVMGYFFALVICLLLPGALTLLAALAAG